MERDTTARERLVFDVGMYDGADSAYYLERGFRVVAVEANAYMVRRAEARFPDAITSGRLVIESVAIAGEPGVRALTLNRANPGGSSLFSQRLAKDEAEGVLSVPAVTLPTLFEKHGVPHFMKVDIEGADRFCILPLTSDRAPRFVSFEMGDDAEELVTHLRAIGYRRFKVIDQLSFRELDNMECIYDRGALRLMRLLGYSDPSLVRRRGRFFARGHSSGPLPELSDGRWSDAAAVLQRWRADGPELRTRGWYDLHASLL